MIKCKNPILFFSSTSGGHKVSVDCIQWYPHDTGLFMTLAADQTLKVWDANEIQV